MSKYIDVSNLDIPSDENDYDELVAFADKIAEMIVDAPSIDIVRCAECKHRNEWCGMGEHRWCEMLNMSTTPDDYCSYGERKEGE